MALSPISASDDWSQEIADVAEEFFNCTIDVLLPGDPGTYNGATDTYSGGSDDTILIENRAARAQHIRLPLEMAGSSEWATKRRYRFQITLDDTVVTKGAIVRVRDGGRDKVLESFTYTVISASNSSHAAVRTIETVTELAES